MFKVLRMVLALALLVAGASVALAQDNTPQQVELALQDLSTRTGQTLTLADLDTWTWNEQVFNDASMGCPLPDQMYAQVATRGFQFVLTYQGTDYDYRVASDGSAVILCPAAEGTATPVPAATATPVPQSVATPTDTGLDVQYQDIRFSVDAALASDVTVQVIPEVSGEDLPFFSINPEYLRFDFTGFPAAREYFTGWVEIYPVAEYENLGPDFVTPVIENLQQLLDERPDLAAEEQLPYLPIGNAAQVMHAQAEYLEFDGGSGIRYLTAFHQAPFPVSNEDLLYTFQGMTDDGQFYVSAVFPVTSTALPDAIDQSAFNYDEFVATIDQYFADTTAALNALAPDGFTPNLDTLDAVITSLNIGGSSAGAQSAAPALADTNSLVEALRGAGATVDRGNTVSQPFFSAPGQILDVNGNEVQVFEYADTAALDREAGQVSANGTTIGSTMMSWVDAPHFFRAGNLLALYIGSDAATLSLLQNVLGPQFAGQ